MAYRSTPIASTGVSPAELIMVEESVQLYQHWTKHCVQDDQISTLFAVAMRKQKNATDSTMMNITRCVRYLDLKKDRE